MIINEKTKISELIKHNKETIEVISSINKHFKKLKNPFLRKALAPRVTIADAAKIGGVPVRAMIDKLKEIGFKTDDDRGDKAMQQEDKKRINKNEIKMKKENVVELDVRPILEGGTDPFEAIMAKLKSMDEGQTLKIINTFEPIPLLNILKKKGYIYQTERPEAGVVFTFIEKAGEGQVKESSSEPMADKPDYEQIEKQFAGKMTEVDVRDLEMPMPMVTILEEIEKIDKDHALYVHHKRLPQYLLPELEERGYSWVSKKIDDSNLKFIIFK